MLSADGLVSVGIIPNNAGADTAGNGPQKYRSNAGNGKKKAENGRDQ
jgi:hypothetical protein